MITDVAIIHSQESAYLISSQNIVTDVSAGFTQLTGHSKDELIKKNEAEIFETLLKLSAKALAQIETNNILECYIFSKSLEPIEVTISSLQWQSVESKIYTFQEKLNSKLSDKINITEQMFADNTKGAAIFSVPDLILLKANQKYLDYCDAPFNKKEASIGKAVTDIATKYVGSEAEDALNKVLLSQKTSYVRTFSYEDVKTGITYKDSTFTPIFDNGKIKYVFELATSVTNGIITMPKIESQADKIIFYKEKRMEQDKLAYLQASLLDLSNEAIFAWSLDGGIIYWNKGAEKLYGYSSKETIACNSHELLKTKYPGGGGDIKTILERDEYWNGEIEHTCKDGEIIIVESVHQVIIDEKGKPIVLETNRDITRRKKDEEIINKQNLVLSAIKSVYEKAILCESMEEFGQICLLTIQSLTGGKISFIDELDSEGTLKGFAVCNASEEMCKMLGNNKYGQVKKNINTNGIFDQVIKSGKSIIINNFSSDPDTYRIPKGHVQISSFICAPFIYKQKLRGIIGVANREGGFRKENLEMLEAITPTILEVLLHKKTDIQLLSMEKEQKEALKKSVEKKDEFLCLISHELKTPIAVINSAVQAMEIICKNELSEKAKGYLNKIRQNSNRQLKLVNNILDNAKLEEGHFKINRVSTDIVLLTRTITEAITIFAEQKAIKLTFTSPLAEKVISIDEDLYEKILFNLLSNAIKFTPKGKEVAVKVFQKNIGRVNQIHIQIKDKGIGIPIDKRELIFEKFGQVDSSLSRYAEGSGIGLSIVKRLVDMQGGEIMVESKEGTGSTFTIIFSQIVDGPATPEKEKTQKPKNSLQRAASIEFSDVYLK